MDTMAMTDDGDILDAAIGMIPFGETVGSQRAAEMVREIAPGATEDQTARLARDITAIAREAAIFAARERGAEMQRQSPRRTW